MHACMHACMQLLRFVSSRRARAAIASPTAMIKIKQMCGLSASQAAGRPILIENKSMPLLTLTLVAWPTRQEKISNH